MDQRKRKKIEFIQDYLKKDNVPRSTIPFYLHFMKFMEVTYPFTTTTDKLAASYDKSSRQIRRYIKTLCDLGYLYKKKNIDWSDPNKPIHVNSTYTWTTKSEKMLESAAAEYDRIEKIDRNVNFLR